MNSQFQEKLLSPQPNRLETQHDLALAYSPGVAEPCLEIEKDPSAASRYTARANLVAVISMVQPC